MTYKNVKDTIKFYEKKVSIEHQIWGEHGNNPIKEKNFLAAEYRRAAAVSALFDAEELYSKNNNLSKELLNKHINEFESGVKKLITNYNKECTEASVDKAFYLEEQVKIYKKVFNSIFELNAEDLKKIIKYAKRKKAKHLNADLKKLETNEKTLVNQLTSDVNKSYDEYAKEQNARKNIVPHVGTTNEEVEIYKSLISKEQINFILLINAIKDALHESNNDILFSKETIENNFNNIDVVLKPRDKYLDNNAFNLGYEGIELYSNTYSKVYSLTSRNKNKLQRNLKGKL